MTKKRLCCIFWAALLMFTALMPVSTKVYAAKAKIIGMASNLICTGPVNLQSNRIGGSYDKK